MLVHKNILALVQWDNLTVYEYDIIPVLSYLKNISKRIKVLTPSSSKIISDAVTALNLKQILLETQSMSLETDKKKYILLEKFYEDSFFSDLKTNGIGFLNYALFDRIFYIMINRTIRTVDLDGFDLVIIIGGASDGCRTANYLTKQAKKLNIPIWGFPLGDIEGRLAPFWQYFCEKVFVKRDQKRNLKNIGFFNNEIELYESQPLNLSLTIAKKLNDLVLLDVTHIPIPNPDLFRTLKILEQNDLIFDYILHVPDISSQKLYDILLTKRLKKTKIRYAQPSSYFNDLISSKFVLSFGPVYRSVRLSNNLKINTKLFAVDYHRRYELIDGTDFTRLRVNKINNDKDLIAKIGQEV